MSLEKILSIGGKPGLYKLLTQTRSGFVAESLIDKKKISVGLQMFSPKSKPKKMAAKLPLVIKKISSN